MNLKENMEKFQESHKEYSKEVGGAFFYNHMLKLEKHSKVLTLDYPLELKDNNGLADGIVALVDSLELKNVIYVGQSYGGMIAQVIAKRHPEKVFGLVLSNTGTATNNIIPSDERLRKMMEGHKMGVEVLKTTPYDQVKQHMLQKMEGYLDTVEETYKEYLRDIFKAMVEALPTERNLLMVGLLYDFHQNYRFTKEDFKELDGRVLLVLSPDDQTFSEAVRSELISIMPNPIVNGSLGGGHLALVVKIDAFIDALLDFGKTLK